MASISGAIPCAISSAVPCAAMMRTDASSSWLPWVWSPLEWVINASVIGAPFGDGLHRGEHFAGQREVEQRVDQ